MKARTQQTVEIVRSMLEGSPRKIAFAGRAGCGKDTIAEILANKQYPVINHADMIKEDILEWLVDAMLHGFEPEDSFEHFANWIGISPSRIEQDMWELVGPIYGSFVKMYVVARREKWQVVPFIHLEKGTYIKKKVDFVNAHKEAFRRPQQLYGQFSKEIAADPYYWVNQTITRSIGHPIVFNADCRFPEELQCLRACGWSAIYLWIDDITQELRRPEMTEEERSDLTEWSLRPEDCDYVVDATKPVPLIIDQIGQYLEGKRAA